MDVINSTAYLDIVSQDALSTFLKEMNSFIKSRVYGIHASCNSPVELYLYMRVLNDWQQSLNGDISNYDNVLTLEQINNIIARTVQIS